MKTEKNQDYGQGLDLEIIDLEAYAKADKKPPVGKKYKVKIGVESFVFDHHLITGKELLVKAGKLPVECYSIYQKLKGCDFEKITFSETVDLSKPGIEHFVVKDPEIFHYTIDDEPESTEEKFLTPNKILSDAGLKPEDYYLVQIFPDGSQESYLDKPQKPIEMKCPGPKFISVFRGETPVS